MCIVVIGVNNLMTNITQQLPIRIETSNLINDLVEFNLSNDQIISIDDYLNHLVVNHHIKEFNINRLVNNFEYNTEDLPSNEQLCGYYILNNKQSCKISDNWGNNQWNTQNTVKRFVQPSNLFNTQISALLRGFNDFELPLLNERNMLTTQLVDNHSMTVINRISTLYQKKKVLQKKNKLSDFDILVASSFNDVEPIIEQFELAFTSTNSNYVLLEPIVGKNNAETIAFRSPILQNEFKRLFRENPDKQLVMWKDGHYQYLNSIGLDEQISEGSKTTKKEKYEAYKHRIVTNKGHHTQYIIFGLGLFHNRPQQLIEDSLKTEVQFNLPSLEEIERVRITAKKIDKYVTSFMMKDHSINAYLRLVDEYCDRWIEIITDNPNLVYVENKVICKEDCETKVFKDFSRCNKHLKALDN